MRSNRCNIPPLTHCFNAGMVIMNPNSGPTLTANADYVIAVNGLRAADVKVVGYVYTSWGNRSSTLVKSDIDLYYAQYNIDGIFFDEASTNVDDVPYYQEISDYVYSMDNHNYVVLNPGTNTAEEYISIANITVIFENSAASYMDSWEAPSYLNDYPSHKYAHMIHSTPAELEAEIAQLSYQRKAGYVFITDDVMPNPYDALPTYLSEEVTDLSANCAAGSPQDDTLSAGAVAGIVIGAVVVFALATLGVLYLLRKRNEQTNGTKSDDSQNKHSAVQVVDCA